MARINQQLLERLKQKLDVGQAQVYRLINQKARDLSLQRDVAAIALASERGINVSKYADAAQLAEIRQARAGTVVGAVTTPPTVVAATTSRGASTRPRPRRRATAQRAPSNSVFVVHGRNLKARDELFKFLRALGLQPIEWTQAIRMTREATPYVGTILDTAFREAAAIVVLLTPDDEAKLRRKYRRAHEPSYETRLTGQARPNVLFEAGMAFGRNPSSTVLVQLGGEMRPFSDVGGRHVVHLSNAAASRRELSTKLRNAGCAVNEEGTAWLSDGDLSL